MEGSCEACWEEAERIRPPSDEEEEEEDEEEEENEGCFLKFRKESSLGSKAMTFLEEEEAELLLKVGSSEARRYTGRGPGGSGLGSTSSYPEEEVDA